MNAHDRAPSQFRIMLRRWRALISLALGARRIVVFLMLPAN